MYIPTQPVKGDTEAIGKQADEWGICKGERWYKSSCKSNIPIIYWETFYKKYNRRVDKVIEIYNR